MFWVTVKGINKTFVYPTAKTKDTGFLARTLKFALPEGVESFPNIQRVVVNMIMALYIYPTNHIY